MKVLVSSLCLLALSSPLLAQGPPAFDAAAVDAYVAEQVRKNGYVGLSLAVVKDGKLVLAKGYGKRSVETGEPVTPATRFGIGSVSKQFTCACILLLAEEGKLSIADPVAKYYPELTSAKDITLHDLMTHLSGYPDYYPLDFVDRRMMKPIAVEQVVQEYSRGKLDFEPRTRWSYSNTGYLILGRIVEMVSGLPFPEFLARRVFKPLELNDTAFEPPDSAPSLATGHASFALGEFRKTPREAAGWIHAAGGIFSTPTDLAKWDLALMEGKLLKPESYQIMITPGKLADGKSTSYACGLGRSWRNGYLVLGHSGGVSGFISQNMMIPATKSACITLTNCEEFLSFPGIQQHIMRQLVPKDPPKEKPVIDPSEALPKTIIPKVAGLPAKEFALAFLKRLQAGDINREELGEEFSFFLSPEKLKDASSRLKELGEPTEVIVEDRHERGGMEVAVVRIKLPTVVLKAIMYRSPDGKLQQYLVQRGQAPG